MRTSGQRTYLSQTPVPKMPPGLVDLMEGMTKEVLKKNPTDIYEFCADHMRKLLEIRDGLVQEQFIPLKIKRTKVHNRREIRTEKYSDILKEEPSDFKDNVIPDEELKESNEVNFIRIDVKNPVHHQMDLMKTSVIEIDHNSINPENIGKRTVAKTLENVNIITLDENYTKMENPEIQYIELPNSFQIKERNPNDINETNNTDIIILTEPILEVKLTTNTYKVKNTEILEGNQSNIIDYTKTIEKENIQASVINEIDILTNEMNVTEILQKEIYSTGNGITEVENCTNSFPTQDATEGTLKLTSDEYAPMSHNANELNTKNEEIKNINIDNNDVHSIDEMQKLEQKQITLLFDDTAKEEPINLNLAEGTLKIASDKHVSMPHNANELNTKNEEIKDMNLDHVVSIDEVQKQEQNQIAPLSEDTAKEEPTHLNLVEGTGKITSDEHDSMYHNVNEFHNIKEIENIATANIVASVDAVQNVEQKQINPLFEDTTKEGKICEAKVSNEENNFNDNYFLMEIQGYIPSETKELDDSISYNIDSSKKEVIPLKEDEHNNSFVKNVTNIDSNNGMYSSIYSTIENKSVFNDLKHLKNKHLEELDSDFEKNIAEPHTLSEDKVYNHLQMKSDNENIIKSPQCLEETDVDKQSINNIKVIAPTHSNETSPDYDIVEKSKSIDNTRNTLGNANESSHMDLETAAITIQKVFRSFLYKSRGSTFEDVANDEHVLNDKDIDIYTSQNIERRPLGITRIDSVLQTVNEEKSLSLSTDDSSTLSSAATIIQAHVRGFLVRNKVNYSKNVSTNSLINSDGYPIASSDEGDYHQTNKTVLNIHIVPEADNKSFNRDETVITSVDLSLDCSPPTSMNLHPLGYDKSEPRKQLKREDAFQSISPPSNNSGKLSEDIDSRELVVNDNIHENLQLRNGSMEGNNIKVVSLEPNDSLIAATQQTQDTENEREYLTKMSSDELDVVTPFIEQNVSEVDNTSKLIHSGEFHDVVVVPTKVTRSDTSVVRGE